MENGIIADVMVTDAIALIARPTVAEAISEADPGTAGELDRAPWREILWRFRLELAAIDPRIEITPTGLKLPDDLPYEKWKIIGALLAERWPAPGSEDTELGVLMELEMGHGETEVHAGVQA